MFTFDTPTAVKLGHVNLRAEGLEVKQNKKTGRWRVKDVDGPRYKALGNSWAVPCARWIGARIDAALDTRCAKDKVTA